MHSSYFVLKNKEGKQAEQLVKDYLTGRGYTVQDVSEEQDNYQNDVDFIVQKDGRTSKIEVKLDTRLAETQNIAFEDVFYLKDKETGQTETREGYYHYSQCDFLIFVSPADRNLYMVHTYQRMDDEVDSVRPRVGKKKWVSLGDIYSDGDAYVIYASTNTVKKNRDTIYDDYEHKKHSFEC